MILSTDAEKACICNKKILSKIGIEGNFPNLIHIVYIKPTANTILNGEKLEAFPLRSITKQGHALSLPLITTFQHHTRSLG